ARRDTTVSSAKSMVVRDRGCSNLGGGCDKQGDVTCSNPGGWCKTRGGGEIFEGPVANYSRLAHMGHEVTNFLVEVLEGQTSWVKDLALILVVFLLKLGEFVLDEIVMVLEYVRGACIDMIPITENVKHILLNKEFPPLDLRTKVIMKECIQISLKFTIGSSWNGDILFDKLRFRMKEAVIEIERNLEAYVDDMVIKSKVEQDLIQDVEETLLTLKKVNMKLNPEKCSFGMKEEAVEEAFQAMKTLIAELPTLTSLKKDEELKPMGEVRIAKVDLRRSKQPFNLEESPIDTMADQRTMAELLRAPTKGYAEAIVVPLILAEQFELKHSLINMMTSDQFFGLEKDNPHDHIRCFNKITSTIKYKDVPNSAWDRYKDLLRACPHHGFTELHQLDTFYNALNPTDQDSLNSATGSNLLERSTQDVLTIIENKSKVRNSRNKSVVSQVKSCDANSNSSSDIAKLTHAVNQKTSAVTTAMTAILKQFQATPPPASVKAVEEICVTCGGAHPYYQCLAAGGNTFPKLKDNIQGYASLSNKTNEIKNMMAGLFQMNTASTSGSGSLPSNTVANPEGELEAITTQSGLFLDGPTIPTPPPFINPKVDERVEETLTNQDFFEYTIKVPPPPV
nr:hypothetical protein [Tanacetum cinerariifolium]